MKQVVAQFPYAAVVEREPDVFDVWRWNVYKMKWTRMANTACGYGTAAGASITAAQVSDETAWMLASNKRPPAPLR